MWQDAEYLEDLAGQDYAMWFPTHTSLFMGESVEKLTASLFSDDPAAHKVAFHAGMRRCEANLTNLWITGKEVIERCFQSFPFSTLDTLAIHGADMAVLPDLTSLPRLRDLTIRNPQMANPPQPVSQTKTSVVETFKLLQQPRVTAHFSALEICPIWLYLPRTEKLQLLEWIFPRGGFNPHSLPRIYQQPGGTLGPPGSHLPQFVEQI